MNQPAEAWDALVERHWQEVFGFLMVIARNRAVAEDLAQDVFLLAVRKGVRPGPELSGWLRTVARNLALNELRRKRPSPADPVVLARDLAASESGTPQFDQELTALRQCLSTLSEGDRGVLRARYETCTPLANIAQTAGQTAGYLKQRLLRLRRRLAQCVRLRLANGASPHG